MTASQWAQILGCSTKTVQERLRLGDLPGEKFGEDWICPTEAMLARINEIAIQKMMARRAAASKPQAPKLVAVGGQVKRTPPPLG